MADHTSHYPTIDEQIQPRKDSVSSGSRTKKNDGSEDLQVELETPSIEKSGSEKLLVTQTETTNLPKKTRRDRFKDHFKSLIHGGISAAVEGVSASRRTTGTFPDPNARTETLDFNSTEILEYAALHKTFSLGAFLEVSNLSKFDDLTTYGILVEEEERLWKLEVNRLIECVRGNEPLLFDSEGILSKDGNIETALKNVADVAYQILAAAKIWEYDNVLLSTTGETTSTTAVHEEYAEWCKKSLKRVFGDEWDTDLDPTVLLKKPILMKENNTEVYYLLVDYVTAVVARVLLYCASSQTWYKICIAIVGKCAAKLKVIENSPERFAAESLANGYDASETKKQDDYLNYLENGPQFNERDPERSSPPLEAIYYSSENHMRRSVAYLIRSILFSFIDDHKAPHKLEICSRVYLAGMNDNPVILSSDRRGEFAATSDGQMLRNCYAGFDILFKTCRRLQQMQPPSLMPPQPEDVKKDSAVVKWDWEVHIPEQTSPRPQTARDMSPEAGSFELQSVDHLISVMVPGSLCNAHAAIEIKSLMDFTRLYSYYNEENPVLHPPFVRYSAKFMLKTKVFEKTSAFVRDFQQQTKSLVNAQVFSQHIIPNLELLSEVSSADRISQFDKFERRLKKTDSWEVDESSVQVSASGYVWSVLTVCMVLVVGGLSAPLSGKVVLKGVDPFNISMFVWLLVGFILLVAQSRFVPNWTWHDFLRRRIVCQSVTELANVTGLDPQEVLHKLLVSEKNTVLEIRGPFNSMFRRRRVDGIGFSIDVPTTTSTMYASGFILLHGLTPTGSMLVCIDSRPDSDLLSVSHRGPQGYIGCDALPSKLGGQEDRGKILRLKTLSAFSSEKLIGVFLGERKFG